MSKKKHRHARLKSFPKQTVQITTERLKLIQNIEQNLANFGFDIRRLQLFTLELDTCSFNILMRHLITYFRIIVKVLTM